MSHTASSSGREYLRTVAELVKAGWARSAAESCARFYFRDGAPPQRKRRAGPPATCEADALRAWKEGMAPVRPRNEHERRVHQLHAAQQRERDAKAKLPSTRGRKADPTSATWQAAGLALCLFQSGGCSRAGAARTAAEVYDVNADNVRAYARRLERGPQVTVHGVVGSGFFSIPQSKLVPLLHSVEDADNAVTR